MTPRLTWLILACVAVALRLPDIGNPLVDLDEQMYLLVGQRMWDGAIPYVAIWDRKPIGLFLLYAASAAIPADPVVAYHVVALVAAVATAGLIAALVRRVGTPAGGLAAGIVYLVWLGLIGGRGGQSPVFYDLPMAAAALLVWRAQAGGRRDALLAMLLVGVALQIKPTVVFEGAFLGIALLVASWRRHRRVGRLAGDAILYAGVALLPTLLAGAVYAGIGHGEAWWFANVRSIFLRRVMPGEPIADRLFGQGLVLAVPLLIAIRGLLAQPPSVRLFLGGWLATAILGWLLVPPYFNHYALPLLVPIAIAAGGALDRRSMQLLAALAGGALLIASGYPHAGETADTRRRLAALAEGIRGAAGPGCPFVFEAPPALYTVAHACLPTRYPFPPHLVEPSEAGAIGVDPRAELRRILAARPPVIAVGPPAGRREAEAMVAAALRHGYHPVAHDLGITLYARN